MNSKINNTKKALQNMGKLLKMKEAADYLHVSQDCLRKWDRTDKLKPFKTAGGHRRYDTDSLDEFLGKKNVVNYGNLYEHLCSASYISQMIGDENAEEIEKIRVSVGDKLLKLHEKEMGC